MKKYYVVVVKGEEKVRTSDQNEAIEVFSQQADLWQKYHLTKTARVKTEVPVLYEEFA